MIRNILHYVQVIDMSRSLLWKSADALYIVLRVKVDELLDWVLFWNRVDILLCAYGVDKMFE